MDDAWSPLETVSTETKNLSKRAQSMAYLKALRRILDECDPKDVPSFNGKFSRKWFSDRIGCSPATLTTSIRLRKLLERWEDCNKRNLKSRPPRLENDETNVVRLPRHKSQGRIYFIPVTIAKDVKPITKTVPTLVWEDGIDEWVSDYARHLIFRSHNGRRSVEETVKKLRQFRRFQRRHGVSYDQVTDDFLLAFQGAMESEGRAKARRRDEVLSAVHDLFKWIDGRGLLTNHIQTRPKGEYDLPDDYQFPISSMQVNVRGRHGQSLIKWVSTLTGGTTRSSYGTRNTPTSEQVLELGEVVEANNRNGVRNKLIMDWALFTGARVGEIVQLKESDLPSFDDAQAFFDDQGLRVFEVIVERKNRGKAILRVPGDLALRTAEYLAGDEQRAAIVRDRMDGKRSNDTPIFLSEKGRALDPDSITRIFRGYFKKIGVNKANIHRLRAKYIIEMIEFQLDRYNAGGLEIDMLSNWQDTILVAACQAMGHSHPISLLPYLTEILQRRATLDGRLEPRSAMTRERSIRSMITQMDNRLKHQSRLIEIAKLLENGRYDEAVVIVADFHEQIRGLI